MNVRASKKLQFGVKSLSAVRRVFYLLRIFFSFLKGSREERLTKPINGEVILQLLVDEEKALSLRDKKE